MITCSVSMQEKDQTTPIFLQQNLRCLRKKLNLSQEELAGRLGLNRGNIASYENGSAEPKICNLLKISGLFGVSVLDLTQRDLSQEIHLLEAQDNFQRNTPGDKPVLTEFFRQAEELEQLFNSIFTCQQFQAKKVEPLPRELQFMQMNFEQLFESTTALLQQYKALLELIRCQS